MPVYVFSFFPPSPNPTTETMNWSCVIYSRIIIVSTVYYVIWAIKTFAPPKETIEDYIQAGSGDEENSVIVQETVETMKKEM
jgi:hypothetical protein